MGSIVILSYFNIDFTVSKKQPSPIMFDFTSTFYRWSTAVLIHESADYHAFRHIKHTLSITSGACRYYTKLQRHGAKYRVSGKPNGCNVPLSEPVQQYNLVLTFYQEFNVYALNHLEPSFFSKLGWDSY